MGRDQFVIARKKLNDLIKERRIKAAIYPHDPDFPEKKSTLAERVFKNESTGAKETKIVDVPLVITIIAYKGDDKIHDLIDGIIKKEDVPYEIAVLSTNP